MARRVLRYEIPVDDKWHRVTFTDNSNVVHVGCRNADIVEFWAVPAYGNMEAREVTYEFRVFGTGHPIDDGAYIGTAISPGGNLVWHLFCRKVNDGT